MEEGCSWRGWAVWGHSLSQLSISVTVVGSYVSYIFWFSASEHGNSQFRVIRESAEAIHLDFLQSWSFCLIHSSCLDKHPSLDWSSKSRGEGNGTPLQYSCLENPMDGGAWWAAVHGVAKSRTRLERLHFHFSLSCIGEGNGNPLQCSYLENPRDGGAWWAAVYRVAQSRTWLRRLSSSSSSKSRIEQNFWTAAPPSVYVGEKSEDLVVTCKNSVFKVILCIFTQNLRMLR